MYFCALIENLAYLTDTGKGTVYRSGPIYPSGGQNLALEDVRSGVLDTYFFCKSPLKPANDARNDPGLRIYDKTAGSLGFFVNPAPAE